MAHGDSSYNFSCILYMELQNANDGAGDHSNEFFIEESDFWSNNMLEGYAADDPSMYSDYIISDNIMQNAPAVTLPNDLNARLQDYAMNDSYMHIESNDLMADDAVPIDLYVTLPNYLDELLEYYAVDDLKIYLELDDLISDDAMPSVDLTFPNGLGGLMEEFIVDDQNMNLEFNDMMFDYAVPSDFDLTHSVDSDRLLEMMSATINPPDVEFSFNENEDQPPPC